MTKHSKPLKYIFDNHFHKFWKNNKHKFPKNTHASIWNNVNRFLDCGDISKGYTAFKCNKCTHTHITPFSCKSRFCSSCGKIYAENWELNLKDQLIDAPHIHCIFTSGGLNKNSNWKNIKSLPWIVLKKSWQRCSLKIIQNFANKAKNTNLNNKISLCFHKYKNGFYVNADRKINNILETCKYIGRYLARPAISEYRISKITQSHISFWYQKPDSKDKIFFNAYY